MKLETLSSDPQSLQNRGTRKGRRGGEERDGEGEERERGRGETKEKKRMGKVR